MFSIPVVIIISIKLTLSVLAVLLLLVFYSKKAVMNSRFLPLPIRRTNGIASIYQSYIVGSCKRSLKYLNVLDMAKGSFDWTLALHCTGSRSMDVRVFLARAMDRGNSLYCIKRCQALRSEIEHWCINIPFE